MAPIITPAGPVPTMDDVPNVPSDMLALATALVNKVVLTYATLTSRNASTPSSPQVCYVTATKSWYWWNSTTSAWEDLKLPNSTRPAAVAISSFEATWSAGSQAPQVRLLNDSMVWLSGIFNKSAAILAASQQIATIPAGYRPATSRIIRPIMLANPTIHAQAYCDLRSTGEINITAKNTPTALTSTQVTMDLIYSLA